MNRLNVVITTYDRGEGSRTPLAIQTLYGLTMRLGYPDIHYIIADNGSPNPEHITKIEHFMTTSKKSYEIIVTPNSVGVGGSKNVSLKKAFETSPVVLLMEDDWVLNHAFDIRRHVDILLRHDHVGMVRLGYIGGTMTAEYKDIEPFYPVWHLIQGTGVYVYSGQVSLRHKRFYDAVGWHKEGVQVGTEEEEMCHRYNATENAPIIVWPADIPVQFNTGVFEHIGGDASLNAHQPGA